MEQYNSPTNGGTWLDEVYIIVDPIFFMSFIEKIPSAQSFSLGQKTVCFFSLYDATIESPSV